MSSRNYPKPCVKCGARPFEPCRTLTTGRITDTHVQRITGKRPEGKS